MNKRFVHKRIFLPLGSCIGLVAVLLMVLYRASLAMPITTDVLIVFVSCGLFVAILSSLVFGRIFKRRNRKINAQVLSDLKENETIILEGGSNLETEGKKKGGKLFLTSHRLIFMYPSENDIVNSRYFPLSSINKVNSMILAGLVNTGIRVLVEDKEYYFSLDYSNEWKSYICDELGNRRNSGELQPV